MTYTLSFARTKKPNRYYDSAEDFTSRAQEIISKESKEQKKDITLDEMNALKSGSQEVQKLKRLGTDPIGAEDVLKKYFGPGVVQVKTTNRQNDIPDNVTTKPLENALPKNTTSLPGTPNIQVGPGVTVGGSVTINNLNGGINLGAKK